MQLLRSWPRSALAVLIARFLTPPRVWADSLPLDLESAPERARSDNQLLEPSRLRIEEARGDLLGASVLLVDNPEVFSRAGPRTPAERVSSRPTVRQIGIEHRFEIAHQRRHFVAQARSQLSTAKASWKDASRALELAVATVFCDALAAGRRTGIAAEREAVARRLCEVATIRLKRGEATHETRSGAEVQRPLATVVIGGLMTATLLTPFFPPGTYSWFADQRIDIDV